MFNAKFGWDDNQIKLYGTLIGNAGLFGILFGSVFGGPLINGGRRRAIFLLCSFIFVGSGLSLIETIPTIIIGRIINGFSAGVFNMICSKSMFESVTPKLNDVFGCLTNLSYCAGGIICAAIGLSLESTQEGLKND